MQRWIAYSAVSSINRRLVPMSPIERAHYLANVLLFAGQETPPTVQDALLAHICQDIQASNAELIQASQWLEAGDYQPKPVGRYSTQLKNLEDMLFFSMLTGFLEPATKTQLLSFAQTLGITQAQMRLISTDARQRFDLAKQFRSCGSCHNAIPANSKFCPLCAAAQTSYALDKPKTAAAPSWLAQLPPHSLALSFAASDAPAEALALAKNHHEEAGQRWHHAVWRLTELEKALPLVAALAQQTTRRVYVNGVAEVWETVFGFLACFQARQQHYYPEEHCLGLSQHHLNLWGCQQANMDWQADAAWLCYGHFEKSTVFRFDKKRIQHTLDTRLKPFRLCPALQMRRVTEALRLWPERVVIDRQHWDYQTLPEESLNSQRLLIGEPSRPHTVLQEIYAIGVAPLDFHDALPLLEQVFPSQHLRELLQRRR